jgi:hypothetical protein
VGKLLFRMSARLNQPMHQVKFRRVLINRYRAVKPGLEMADLIGTPHVAAARYRQQARGCQPEGNPQVGDHTSGIPRELSQKALVS